MDVPLGGDGRARDALLPAQDGLPGDLETPERGGHHALQRGADGQHAAVQRARSRAAGAPRARHRRGQSADAAPVRDDGGAELATRARVRHDGDVRAHHEELPAPRVGRAPGEGEVSDDGQAGTWVSDELAGAGHQNGRARRDRRRRGEGREGDRGDCVCGEHLREGVLQGPGGDGEAVCGRGVSFGGSGGLASGRGDSDTGSGQGYHHQR